MWRSQEGMDQNLTPNHVAVEPTLHYIALLMIRTSPTSRNLVISNMPELWYIYSHIAIPLYISFPFLTDLLRYTLQAIKFTQVTFILHWFLVHSQNCPTINTITMKSNSLHVSDHPSSPHLLGPWRSSIYFCLNELVSPGQFIQTELCNTWLLGMASFTEHIFKARPCVPCLSTLISELPWCRHTTFYSFTSFTI